jgi:hypothetical protein
MKKAYTRKNIAAKRKSPLRARMRRYEVVWLVLFGVLIGSVAFFSYRYVKKHDTHSLTPAYFSELSTWLAKRRNQIPHELEDKKLEDESSKEAATPEPIHFEFYTALPNMQLEANQEVTAAAKHSKAPEKIMTTTKRKKA